MPAKKLGLTSQPEFKTDIEALPRDVQIMALNMLVLIRDGKERGVALDQRAIGDLSDCYKFYFDPDGSGKPRYRLVYRYSPDEVNAVAVEAVAVGERAGLDVYRKAIKRLGR